MRILRSTLAVIAVACGPVSASADSSLSWDWLLGVNKLPSPPPAVDYLDLDGFDASKKYVQEAGKNGIKTICYISAGTLEDWRPDRKAFEKLNRKQKNAGKPKIIGKRYPEWPDERWLNFKRYKVFLPLMIDRIERCATKGFDLIEFDNIDGHDNKTGFSIRKRNSVSYAKALAAEATKLGLVPVQKNVTDLNRKLEPHFGALLLEDCVLYRFCGDARRYRKAGKPVFNAEYPKGWKDEGKTFRVKKACRTTDRHDISLIVKKYSLNNWVRRCN
jgi:hypothetical protein